MKGVSEQLKGVPEFFAPLVGGVLGTVLMTAILMFPRWLGIGKIDIIPAVGALITGRVENAFAPGYFIHFASGAVFAYIYWGLLTLLSLPFTFWTGAMAGFIHGMIVMLLVSIVIMEHHPIARYHERGPMTGVAQLLAHIVYGATAGFLFQALQ